MISFCEIVFYINDFISFLFPSPLISCPTSFLYPMVFSVFMELCKLLQSVLHFIILRKLYFLPPNLPILLSLRQPLILCSIYLFWTFYFSRLYSYSMMWSVSVFDLAYCYVIYSCSVYQYFVPFCGWSNISLDVSNNTFFNPLTS